MNMLPAGNLMDSLYWLIVKSISTFKMRVECAFIGVQLEDHCYFFGSAKFKRMSDSAEISFGSGCCLRSISTSNLIGINRPCIFSVMTNNAILKVGSNCGFSGTVIGCFEQITLGNNVRCGANTLITDSDWHPEDSRSGSVRPIFIEDNVWLGVNVIVLKGVRIGKNSVIGAGSVVCRDIPENVVAAGNPCRVIRNLADKAL